MKGVKELEVEPRGGLGKLHTRYVVCILGSIGMGIIYGLKVNFHVAIVSMVNYTAVGGSEHGNSDSEDGPFVWNALIQGLLLSAYFWGYIVSELPGGKLAESYSAKWVMFGAVAINVVAVLLTPICAQLHFSIVIVLRVLQGLGGGVTFPAMHCLLAHWAPPTERSVMSSIVYSGTALGSVIFLLVSGKIAASLGWELIFYIEGGVSALWLIFWGILAADNPSLEKYISPQERDLINLSLHQDDPESVHGGRKASVPWKAIFLSPAFLAILIAHTCSNWGWYMVLVELPLYMKSVLKFKMSENALLTALPFFTMWIFSIIFSKVLDTFREKGLITTTTARKIATGVASLGPLVCFVLLCYIGGSVAGVILMTLAVTAIGGMFSGFLSNHIDISPNFAGTLVAITNTVATIPGIAVPFVVNTLTAKDPSITSWRIIFWITVTLFAIEFIVYTIFGSGEEQPWNNPNATAEAESQPLKPDKAKAAETA
ncbi:sialin [Euwallacea similis]|uniref:sialin n=1 Tax=Euwallacea similis TaxID=1736056 RepID=UPI00344D3A26